jgi:hypothetical protein
VLGHGSSLKAESHDTHQYALRITYIHPLPTAFHMRLPTLSGLDQAILERILRLTAGFDPIPPARHRSPLLSLSRRQDLSFPLNQDFHLPRHSHRRRGPPVDLALQSRHSQQPWSLVLQTAHTPHPRQEASRPCISVDEPPLLQTVPRHTDLRLLQRTLSRDRDQTVTI